MAREESIYCGITTRYAQSLEEFYSHVKNIGEMIRYQNQYSYEPMLWFRGHEYVNYNLEPNIFRNASYRFNQAQTYSNNHLREDYRFQHFMARNYNKVSSIPTSVIEWQQIMQHFFTKTRFMDWSEHVTTALLFALESYINPLQNSDLERRRMDASPVVWILDPVGMNRKVFQSVIKVKSGKDSHRFPLIYKALDGVVDRKHLEELTEAIGMELNAHSDIYFELKDISESNMSGIISLSALEILKKTYTRMDNENLLGRFELNPFFFLLLRYYSDGIGVELDELPPLATIHPYYSERIREQKGAFTIFPYYLPNPSLVFIQQNNIPFNPITMETMRLCQDCLCRIVLTNPAGIAGELLLSGERRGNIYPEMDIIAQDMENVNGQM